MNKNEVIARYSKYIMPTYYPPEILLVHGRGTKVWDADGKVYLDFLSGIAVTNLGHCHPEVIQAVRIQMETLGHVSNLYYTEPVTLLAEKLSSISLGGKCFFCNSGAEANECLFKLARYWGKDKGKYEIVAMKNSFHGRTLATIAATGQEKVQKGFEPLPEGFVFAELNNIDSVRQVISEKTAAVIVEAIQGEGGVIPATTTFLQQLRELCNEKGILLFCDEVQCGMGRTGEWFGFQHSGIKPDAISLAKALGSGYPIGAVVASPNISDVFQPGTHASTFGGSPVACAAALATISTIEKEHLLERAKIAGKKFKEGLESFIGKYEKVKEVRGVGLMVGLVLDQPSKPFVSALAEMGLLANATAGNVVRFLPPLNVKDNEIEEALDIINDALADLHGKPREE